MIISKDLNESELRRKWVVRINWDKKGPFLTENITVHKWNRIEVQESVIFRTTTIGKEPYLGFIFV